MNYYKFNIGELLQINGNAKKKIHDVMAEIFKQKETGINIESIDDEIDYGLILDFDCIRICLPKCPKRIEGIFHRNY